MLRTRSVLASLWLLQSILSGVIEGIGVNYGMVADNLPQPQAVVALLKSRNITCVRLFDPNQEALQALHGSSLCVVVGTRNEDLPKLAADDTFAASWVNTNVVPHVQEVQFRYISIGNEVVPGELAVHVAPAIIKLNAAVKAAHLNIPVTTAIATTVLGISFPPSQGAFSDIAAPNMKPIVAYLQAEKVPLLVNVYPYFAYASNPANISLNYTLFTSKGVVVRDGSLGYQNLFDAIVDAVYSALEKVGGAGVEIVVSESGWPSAGNGDIATIEKASTYNNNLVAHVEQTCGTPKRPGKCIETYLFGLFNENLKPAGTEQNFGLYYPNLSEVYHVNL